MGMAIAATSGLLLAGKHHMREQSKELETTQAARAVIDMIVRDLRLGGACLPVTGDFISLQGVDNGIEDEIITRSGLTRPDLSCIRTSTDQAASVSDVDISLFSIEGFEPGMRAYIRHPNGTGEYFQITTVDSAGSKLGLSGALSTDYPPTSGVYAIDERRFYINWWDSPRGSLPEVMLQVGSEQPQSLAVGIEELDIEYQLKRNCPPCDVSDLPVDGAEWSLVEQVFVTVTARSELPNENGEYYRRTMRVGVKPRNLIPR